MAARGQRGTKKKFLRLLRANFKQLCRGLDGQEPGGDGASVFYEYYRSEMVHTYFSRNPKYAIAEDGELRGAYVGPVRIGTTIHTAINMDRLYRDFRALAKHRAKGTVL